MQYENTGEELRRRSVGDIVNTYGLQAQIKAQESRAIEEQARAALLGVQARTGEALLPGAAAEQRATTAARLAEAQTRVASLPSEIAARNAQATSLLAGASQAPSEIAARKETVEIAKRNQARLEDMQKFEEKKYAGEAVPMEFEQSDGTKIVRNATASEVMKLQAQGWTIAKQQQEKAIDRQERLRTAERLEGKDRQTLRDEATKAEQTILGVTDKGQVISQDPGVQPSIAEHNVKSDNPYIYVYRPAPGIGPTTPFGGSPSTVKVPLVDRAGKRHKARDVTARANKLDMPVEEYVQKFIYGNRPMPQVPVR